MRIAALLMLLLPLCASSQKKASDKAIAYYTLGNDTTVIQYFEYDKHRYKTTFIQFTGAITKCEAEGILDLNGNLKEVRSANYRITQAGSWELVTNGINTYNGDSTIYIATGAKGEIVSRRSFHGQGILANGMDIASFYVFPYMGFYAPQKKGDTLFHRQLSFNGYRNYIVSRQSGTALRIGSNLMGYLTCMVDRKGRLLGIEGVGSSLNIRAFFDRAAADPDILDGIAKRRNSVAATAIRTLRDTARITIGKTNIEVDYWRPHRRGREIFGNVVPWNRVWRTGANNATQLRLTGDIKIGGQTLVKGIYGIWSYPTATQWELIINKNATAWGTDHDPAADILRVPLQISRAESPVEIMRIAFSKIDDKRTTMIIEWDTWRAMVDITTE
ncbi:MAG: DUF2911 domain-containing protein [Chitinophagaceae bacterium]|nr:DUF2911 domain-containing protein [Chitinophagaceae bacterium]